MKSSHVEDYFSQLMDRGHESFLKVGWGSAESQRTRFEILTQIASPFSGTVLDVGCGLGDLYSLLRERAPECVYRGIDIHPKMVADARSRYPGAQFDIVDILQLSEPLPMYDYVVMSGAANIAQDQYAEFLGALISRMFAMASKGVAFNLLSNRADFIEQGEVYADPGRVVNFCLGLTRRVVLRHDYMPHDFTIYLLREP